MKYYLAIITVNYTWGSKYDIIKLVIALNEEEAKEKAIKHGLEKYGKNYKSVEIGEVIE